MDYEEARVVLDRHVLAVTKQKLLEQIADYPERFCGLFRPTKAPAKLLQFLLQSNEIRFGDALEALIRVMLPHMGFEVIQERHLHEEDGNDLVLDQYFRRGDKYYFIEQKLRDDHDSTKKRGQLANFEQKLRIFMARHGVNAEAYMYFIDPSYTKNRRYYQDGLSRLSQEHGLRAHLVYGPGLFQALGCPEWWDRLVTWLTRWKDSLPNIPSVNFDHSPAISAEELSAVPYHVWRKVLENEELWKHNVLTAIFPTGQTLRDVMTKCGQRGDYDAMRTKSLLNSTLRERYVTNA